MECSSIDLLYHSPSSLLTSIEVKLKLLKLQYFLTKEAIDALRFFYEERAIWKFDPHVGETACQIRAYWIYLLNTKNKVGFVQVKQKIEELKKVLDRISQLSSALSNPENQYLKTFSCCEPLDAFLHKNNLIYKLSSDFVFLIQSYILSRFKEDNHIVEYYLLDEHGSFLLLDAKGKPSWLIVKSEHEMGNIVEFAIDQDPPEDIMKGLIDKTLIPYFHTAQD